MKGFRLRHLTFTGPNVAPIGLTFSDGLNVIYGASNTGKSFASKAINFMFGGSQPLPGIRQRARYDAVRLGVILPDGNGITIYRAASGGAFRIVHDLSKDATIGDEDTVLQAQHSGSRDESLSRYLLRAIDMDGKLLVKNAKGKKDSFSFRHLAPYMFVSEEAIISDRSPVLASGQFISQTIEKNTFKLLLTGHDDAAVVTTASVSSQNAARDAQIELIDEWMAQVAEQFGDPAVPREHVEQQAARLDVSLTKLQVELVSRQDRIDTLVSTRRSLADSHEETKARLAELELTLERFVRLASIYDSDIQRLASLEEGGFLLLARRDQTCPVCGAPPEAQHHTHGSDAIDQSHRAAIAEIRKIERERRDLKATTESLTAEAEGLRRKLAEHVLSLLAIEGALADARPLEASIRRSYEALVLARSEVAAQLALYDQCDRLEAKRDQLNATKAKRAKKEKRERISVGIDGTTAFAFSKVVRAVLEEWNFPEAADVRFDPVRQDIEVGGNERAANGKGVRAVLHAAFKVATLIYCRDNGLPHPGVLVLDSPLLSYREPLINPKYGDLQPDEIALQSAGLADRFYAHLISLKDTGQFIVLENTDPPANVLQRAYVEVFTGKADFKRFGFFPPLTAALSV